MLASRRRHVRIATHQLLRKWGQQYIVVIVEEHQGGKGEALLPFFGLSAMFNQEITFFIIFFPSYETPLIL